MVCHESDIEVVHRDNQEGQDDSVQARANGIRQTDLAADISEGGSPYCWEASVDGGKTWVNLKSDNDEDSSEAIEEAAERFGVAPNKWGIEE